MSRIEKMRRLYDQLLDKLFMLDYRDGRYLKYCYSRKEGEEGKEERCEEGDLSSDTMRAILNEILDYVIPQQGGCSSP